MRALSNKLLAAAGKPDKSGGYAEPAPDPVRGEETEDSFHPEYEQGREPKESSREPEHERPAHDKT